VAVLPSMRLSRMERERRCWRFRRPWARSVRDAHPEKRERPLVVEDVAAHLPGRRHAAPCTVSPESVTVVPAATDSTR